MIRKTITITFCFIHAFLMQGQNNSRFPVDPSGRWKITNVEGDIDQKILEKYEYFIESDTLINSQKYYKLYKSGVFYYEEPFYYERVYKGAIRDTNNKFYYVDKDETSEVLLIDFGLELGDTIKSTIGKNFIVNFIDTLPDGRKRISSLPEACGGCCTTVTLIEGIGHSGGIMEDPPCEHIGFWGYYLNCYSESSKLIYKNELSLVNCNDFYSSLKPAPKFIGLNIYPIPATNMLTIDFLDLTESSSLITVYNVSGIAVFSGRYSIKNSRLELDIHNFKNGIYLIKIFNNPKCFTGKFVINR